MRKVKASDFIKKKGDRYHPGTSIKFGKNKSGIKIKSIKHPKFKVGSKVNLK